MAVRARRIALIVVVTVALVIAAPGAPAFAQPNTRPLALVGGTIYVGPTDAPIRNGLVLIERGTITAVGPRGSRELPAGTETIDCTGLTITAGFWNSHVHFMERKWAEAPAIPAAELTTQIDAMLTRYGFTSVFDTGSSWQNTKRIRDRIESGDVTGPRIRSTGEILVPKGGVPPELVFDITGAMRMRIPEVVDAAAARTAATALLDAGADGIKVYAATWAPPIVVMPGEAIRAAADEAHRRGRLLFAHPSNRDGLLNAVRGGADVIVHTSPQSGAWDATIIEALTRARVSLIPTLKLWTYELRHDRISARDRFAAAGIDQLRAWLAAGGRVLFGTDVGYMNDYDPTDEYVLMAKAGMSARQILASLTTTPAERFGEGTQRGRLAQGLGADVVVLNGDPFSDVRSFAAVRYTIRDGRVIYRSNAVSVRGVRSLGDSHLPARVAVK